MAELNIPKEHQAKFVYFVQFPDEVKAKIFEGLNNSQADLNPRLLADDLATNLKELDKDSIFDIVVIYLNLINAKNSFGVSLNEFLLLLDKALEETNIAELKPTKKLLLDFENLLSSGSSIVTKAKMVDLMTENSRTFLDAKLQQDIRPSFDEKGNLVGSVIIHNLKLVVAEYGNKKEIYIALDSNDLEKLLTEIQKAQNTTKLINSTFSNAKFIDL